MNINLTNKLSALICGLILLPLTAFAENKVVDSTTGSVTESGTSYNDSDPALSALNVSGNDVTYIGTNITLSATTTTNSAGVALADGAYVTDRATLSLTGGSITTAGSYGFGIYLGDASSGTVRDVSIETTGVGSRGAYAVGSSTLTLTNGSITTGSNTAYGIHLNGTSSGNISDVSIETTGANGRGVHVVGSSILILTGGSVTTGNYNAPGIVISSTSSGNISDVNIETTGSASHGVYVNDSSTLTLTDSNISATGSNANALYLTGNNIVTASLNSNTITGNIAAGGTSTLTLSGSNGTVITGDVNGTLGSTVGITLDGAGTELHGNFSQDGDSTITLTLGAGALFEGSGELDSLTLANGVTIGYTGLITVTDSIEINGPITIDLSELTSTGDYDIFDWSTAGTVNVDVTNLNFTGAGVDGEFKVVNGQLVFDATAVPEPSTYLLLGAGLGTFLLTAHYRRRHNARP